jgi:hypothetical protein
MDFIGDIGGVTGIMLQICGWILGGYAAFHSAFMTMSALYKVKKNGSNPFEKSKKDSDDNGDVHKIKLSLRTRIYLYLLTTPVKYVISCCKT